MKISYEWLGDFVDLADVSPKDAAEVLRSFERADELIGFPGSKTQGPSLMRANRLLNYIVSENWRRLPYPKELPP